MDNNTNDEIVIDLMDILFFLMKKWRRLLACLLIGAVLGAGLGILRSGELTEEVIEDEVMSEMVRAAQFYNLYIQQLEYVDNSILMKADANNLYYGRLQYHIRADAEINLVKAQYGSILDQELKEQVGAAAGYLVELKYLNEIISCSVDLVTDAKGDNSTATLNAYYTVTGESPEQCEAMLAVLREAVLALESSLAKKYSDFESVHMVDMVTQHSSSGYISHQEDHLAQLNGYLTSMEKLEEEFSDEELYFYQTQLCGIVPEEEPSTVMPVIKWIIIVCFLMGVCWGGWYLAAYLLDKTIKTANEAMDMTGVPLLGRLQDPTKNYKGIDKWIHSLQESTKRTADSLPYVVSLISGMEYGDAVLCGNRRAQEVVEVMDAVHQVCPGIVGKSFITVDADSLAAAKKAGKEILLVRTGRTRKSEIQRELNLCRHQGVELRA